MPISVIMNQLCPTGVEATAYALLAGYSNLGNALGNYVGAFILDQFGIKPTGAPGESHQFDNLWKAVLIVTFLPIIPILAIRFLIPDASQVDSLLPVKPEVRKEIELDIINVY